MTDLLSRRAIAASMGLFAAALGAREAEAAPCASLPQPTYVTGSSAVKPFMAALGQALAGTSTIVYKGQGSCTGVDAILNSTRITGTASFWDAAGMEQTCDLATPAGDVADVGVSDVFATSCPMVASLPATVGDFFGPNQVMTFVVPTASSQVSISAQAAYFVFGFGAAAGGVAPWNVDANVFIRSASSGTQTMIGFATGVAPDKFKGTSQSGSGPMLAAVSTAADPESAIGILAADVADANRAAVKILAYQHTKQKCGYWPDSSASSFDKINVRDGHYPIWGPLHMLTRVSAAGAPVNPEAANLIGVIQGKRPAPEGVNVLDLAIRSYTVPECAMKVKRTTELGDVSAFTPEKSCGCYFDAKANGSTRCQACTGDDGCPASAAHCNFGYCEAN